MRSAPSEVVVADPKRTDARLLVPRSALPFFPLGGQIWPVAWDAPEPYEESSFARQYRDSEDNAMLDLSAPALRDGLPERLDALPWAMLALARRHRWTGTPVRLEPVVFDPKIGPVVELLAQTVGVVRSLVEREPPPWHPAHVRALVVEAFPTLDGLTRDEASRAVVAAALGMKES